MFYEVVLESNETPNKCTIAPLEYRSDFTLWRSKGVSCFEKFRCLYLLHLEGECLSKVPKPESTDFGVASIDCVWVRLVTLLAKIPEPLPKLGRVPDGFDAAYPTRSKNSDGPPGGLATVEAIFIAAALLRNWEPT